jgi:hypothetical protein
MNTTTKNRGTGPLEKRRSERGGFFGIGIGEHQYSVALGCFRHCGCGVVKALGRLLQTSSGTEYWFLFCLLSNLLAGPEPSPANCSVLSSKASFA